MAVDYAFCVKCEEESELGSSASQNLRSSFSGKRALFSSGLKIFAKLNPPISLFHQCVI